MVGNGLVSLTMDVHSCMLNNSPSCMVQINLHMIITTRDFVKGLSAQKAECRRVKVAFSNSNFGQVLEDSTPNPGPN